MNDADDAGDGGEDEEPRWMHPCGRMLPKKSRQKKVDAAPPLQVADRVTVAELEPSVDLF